MKTLGDRIRELREALDLSLRELARMVDVSAAFLSDVELGRRFPSDELLARIAKKLKTTFEDLKSYDSRAPVSEIKRRATTSPAFGFMMRRVVEEGVDAEELKKALEKVHEERRRKEQEESG